MNKVLSEQLMVFGDDDGYEKLERIVLECIKDKHFSAKEIDRLDYELGIVKDTGVARVFIFFYETMRALEKQMKVFSNGIINNSFLCYVLGVTKVNSVTYDLAFSRYFRSNSTRLPYFYLTTQTGGADKALAYFYETFGENKVFALSNERDGYAIAKDDYFEQGSGEKTISYKDAIDKNMFVFFMDQREIKRPIAEKQFTEREIHDKAIALFGDSTRFGYKSLPYEIFSETDGRLVFQEQFIAFCRDEVKMDEEKAEELRKGICKKELAKILITLLNFKDALGAGKGKTILDYSREHLPYAVAMGYVVGQLLLDNND